MTEVTPRTLTRYDNRLCSVWQRATVSPKKASQGLLDPLPRFERKAKEVNGW